MLLKRLVAVAEENDLRGHPRRYAAQGRYAVRGNVFTAAGHADSGSCNARMRWYSHNVQGRGREKKGRQTAV